MQDIFPHLKHIQHLAKAVAKLLNSSCEKWKILRVHRRMSVHTLKYFLLLPNIT